MTKEDGAYTDQRLNGVPIFKGTIHFTVPESIVAGQSIHRPRKVPTAEDLVEGWLGDDNSEPWPEDRYTQWLKSAEDFLEKVTYGKRQHFSLLVRAFERFLQENDLV